MKKLTHEEHENIRDILETLSYCFIFLCSIVFTVFVYTCTAHIDDILKFLAERCGF